MEECDEELDKDDTSVMTKLEETFHEVPLHDEATKQQLPPNDASSVVEVAIEG